MAKLNLIKYTDHLRITKDGEISYVYDIIRKKNLVLLAEELVRQCIIHYFVDQLKISKNLIWVEKGIKVNDLSRRCDIILVDRNANPILLVEVKSPKVKLNQKVFNQIAMYNLPLKVPYLMVSNGKDSYFCKIDFERKSYEFLSELPTYEIMLKKYKLDKNTTMDWTNDEFITYLLLQASFADGIYSPIEKKLILKKSGEEMYNKILQEFEADNLETKRTKIDNHLKIHFTSFDERQELLNLLKRQFLSDTVFSIDEKKMLIRLKKII